jgi:hypothetical protein
MLSKGPNTNGSDLVVQNAIETISVECKQLTSGNVTLGTLGKNALGERGGSINQVISTARRLTNTSVSQLQMEFEAVKNAYSDGTLKNALFTNAEKASKGAQDVFNYVYVAAANGTATVIKGAQAIATKMPETMFLVVPYFMIDPKNSPIYNPQIPQ